MKETSSDPVSLRRSDSTDTSRTLVPSVSGHRKSESSESQSKPSNSSPPSEDSHSTHTCSILQIPTRSEINRVTGADMMKPVNEIDTIPCAGVRISHGPLAGRMAWRLVVQLDSSNTQSRSKLPSAARASVVTNFILDTWSEESYVPPDALVALGYRGRMSPGSEVILLIQRVKTKCLVASPEEAGRLGLSFLTAGSLKYYFDASLIAPVLYDGSSECPSHVPQTIRPEDLSGSSWLVVISSTLWFMITFRWFWRDTVPGSD
ncbi:hypothetical protein B0H19DRAFT_1181717 [Mycena capillaripes]|nr:hypothetical protein B0H19DRAFT_1181717 [Mycena capillaripes]